MPDICTLIACWFLIHGWYRHMASQGPDLDGTVAALIGVLC
ncbi:hypothetical protein [Nocardiopsis sp. CNR-923]|nr:hypothetical protein [Nocardiopsis sp. CNR-923]